MGHDMKFLVIGDSDAGKTELLISYTTNAFPGDYVPTVLDNYILNTMIDKTAVSLGLWDTAASDEYDSLRPLSYPGTDVFLVCFSLVSPEGFARVRTKWVPEIRAACEHPRILLVGTKLECRNKPSHIAELAAMGLKPVTTREGEELAAEIEAIAYCECSALTQEGLQHVFETAARSVLNADAEAAKEEARQKAAAEEARRTRIAQCEHNFQKKGSVSGSCDLCGKPFGTGLLSKRGLVCSKCGGKFHSSCATKGKLAPASSTTAPSPAAAPSAAPAPPIVVVAKEPSIPPPAPPVAAAKPTLLRRPSAARITEVPVTAVAGLHVEATPFDRVFAGFVAPTLEQALLDAGLKEGDVKVLLGECSKVAQSAKAKEAMRGTQLTTADVEALAMYTYSFGEAEEDMGRNPFRVINLALHWQNDRLQKARGLIFLLLHALRKLPRVTKPMLYRGINSHLDTEKYAEGKTVTWAGFSSTSTSLSTVKRFLEKKKADGAGTGYFAGTLFIITNVWGYNLQPFSRFDEEDEVLLEPGVVLRVNGVMKIPNSHSTVELEMVSCPLLLSNLLPPSFKP